MNTQERRQTPEKQPRIVAAIPCFNTERSIKDVIFRTRKYIEQIIVIDDGSHDGTAAAAREAGALVISHGKNRGYGEAIKSCFEAAVANAADILVIIDGDGQHNPDEIPHLLAPLLQGEAELVIGSRFFGGGSCVPRYRKFGIGIITLLFNLGSKTRVSDAQSGFRAYGKRLFQAFSLKEKGMSVSIEILEKARRRKAIIREVPISCLYTNSTLNLAAIKHGLGVALSVAKIRFKDSLRNVLRAK